MSPPTACRACRPVGFLVSALLHLGVAAALLWPQPPGMQGSGEGHQVGVSLAMFQTASEARAAEAAPAAKDQPEPPAEELVEPDPEPEMQPEQESKETPDAPPPEPEQTPEPTVAEEPEPELAPNSRPEVPKRTQAAVAEPPPPPPALAKPKPKPKAEPKPKPKPKVKSRPKPRKPAAETAKRPPAAKAPARREASAAESGARSGKSAAGGAGAGNGRDAAEGRYLAELQAAIAKHRFFPPQARRRGLEGQVTVSFTLEGNGRITGIRVVKGSGSSVLDEAAVETLKRLGRFKPIPKAIGRTRWTLRVPIGFTLR